MFTVIAVEETIQRSSRKFYLTLDTSGVSSFQYQLANLIAHSVFYLFAYLFLFLYFRVTG